MAIFQATNQPFGRTAHAAPPGQKPNVIEEIPASQILRHYATGRGRSQLTLALINTVSKMLVDAGEACIADHDELVRNVTRRRVQCDEIWSFCHAKEKNVAVAKAATDGAGDVWTWTALDADSTMILSYYVGDRSGQTAILLMDDLRSRLDSRVQVTTDGHKAYLEAVEGAFGGDVDYAMLVELDGESADEGDQRRYGPAECTGTKKIPIEGNPDMKVVSTSYVERQNLNMQMGMRRFTRLTNAFSQKLESHCHALALYFMFYNFVRIHKTLKVTPAMAAGYLIGYGLWRTSLC